MPGDPGDKIETAAQDRADTIADTLGDLEADYNRCYRVIRKTYDCLERLGLREFNRCSKYRWSLDRDLRGYSYVCVRVGASLMRRSLIKRSGNLTDEELYRWAADKDLVCDAIDEAHAYLDRRLDALKSTMGEIRDRLSGYESRLADRERAIDEVERDAGRKIVR